MKSYTQLASRRGFTLLEMMLVVLIIGMLAAAVAWNFAGQGDKARIGTTKANLKTLQNMVVNYQIDTGQYPPSLQALVPAYTAKIGVDGWKRDFVYYTPSPDGRPYALFSMGADATTGGPDDISVWTMDDVVPTN